MKNKYSEDIKMYYDLFPELVKEIMESSIITIFPKELIIQQKVYDNIQNGSKYSNNLPMAFKFEHPELFLDEKAPEKMQQQFYEEGKQGSQFSYIINENWDLSYLEGKDTASFFKRSIIDYSKYFELFANEALSFGLEHAEIVDNMAKMNASDQLYNWNEATKGEFFPATIIMKHLDKEYINPFLTNFSKWIKLVKSTSIKTEEDRLDLLKVALHLGVFHGNEVGYNKLLFGLKEIPVNFTKKAYEELKNQAKTADLRYTTKLKYMAIGENFASKDSTVEDVIELLYPKVSPLERNLITNINQFPKTHKAFRELLNGLNKRNKEIEYNGAFLSKKSLHFLADNLSINYNPKMSDFLTKQFHSLLLNPESITKLPIIEEQINEINEIYPPNNQTFKNVISYVKTRKYFEVLAGNEPLAMLAKKNEYKQEEFNKLQEYYELGKRRTKSSIPTITGKENGYYYQMLPLTSLRHLEIGNEIDCCQKLKFDGETCMQHSMTNPHGRVFAIFDENRNAVAQSWVWRNGNTICFDNIEISKNLKCKEELSLAILSIYLTATKELFKIDTEYYQKEFLEGKINEEEFNKYILNKVTVGSGENGILPLLKNATVLDESPSTPNPCEIENLYLVDSGVQYVLHTKGKKPTQGEAIKFHSDEIIPFQRDNIITSDLKKLFEMNLLEETREEFPDVRVLDSYLSNFSENINYEKMMQELPLGTKLIITPTLGVLYEEKDNKIVLKQVSSYLDNKEKAYKEQLAQAIMSLGTNYEIDSSFLTSKKQEQINLINYRGTHSTVFQKGKE